MLGAKYDQALEWWNGPSVSIRSSLVNPAIRVASSPTHTQYSCDSAQAFGTPVVPELKIRLASARGSCQRGCGGRSPVAPARSSTCTAGSGRSPSCASAATPASSTTTAAGSTRATVSTKPRPRWPGSKGATIAPAYQAPNTAASSPMWFSARTSTRSPGATPRSASRAAAPCVIAATSPREWRTSSGSMKAHASGSRSHHDHSAAPRLGGRVTARDSSAAASRPRR